MSEPRNKSNKKFMLLSAIGIFMVVDQHTFMALNILGDYIPYNSFFMPMFVFISGYFNKVDNTTNLPSYLLKKIKTLLIPYTGISLTVFAVQQLINRIKLGSEMNPLPSGYLGYALGRIVTKGTFGAIVAPMWFVIALFSTLIIYAILKKLLCRIWNSYVMFVIFCCLHCLAIYLAKTLDMEACAYLLVPLKCLFFFPFIELGIIYREHLEKKHEAIPAGGKVWILLGLLAVNAIRTLYMPAAYDIAFDSIDDMSGFTSPYLVTPLISSVIGILFWLTVAELVGKKVYESRFVNYMSCNTFWIMGLHIMFFNILNCVFMGISNHIAEIPYFDIEEFKGSEWYFWGISNNVKILYVIVGILGPLGLKKLYDKYFNKVYFIPVFAIVIAATVILTRPRPDDYSDDYDLTDYEDTDYDERPGDPENTVYGDTYPVYLYIDLAYGEDGIGGDYLTEPYAVYGDETCHIVINRSDDKDTAAAIDGLSYFAIRILDDEMSDVDISGVNIDDITVLSDGAELSVSEIGTGSYDDGAYILFFECTDGDGESYDFTDVDEIEISFDIEGTEIR